MEDSSAVLSLILTWLPQIWLCMNASSSEHTAAESMLWDRVGTPRTVVLVRFSVTMEKHSDPKQWGRRECVWLTFPGCSSLREAREGAQGRN